MNYNVITCFVEYYSLFMNFLILYKAYVFLYNAELMPSPINSRHDDYWPLSFTEKQLLSRAFGSLNILHFTNIYLDEGLRFDKLYVTQEYYIFYLLSHLLEVQMYHGFLKEIVTQILGIRIFLS